jgi:putative transposase
MELLQRQTDKEEIALLGFCLMTNHVHHEPIPRETDSLSKYMRTMDRDYSRVQNLHKNQTGHLWQGRFFSCPVYDKWQILAYVELNPYRAQMVQDPGDWEWSSARAHLQGEDHSGLLNMELWRKNFDPYSWRQYLREFALQTAIHDQIRKATKTGRFCGHKEIAKKMEEQYRKNQKK